MATCKYCGTAIDWMRDGRKNVAIGMDGLPHQCEEFKKARKVRTIDVKEIDPELLKQYEQGINKKK